MRHIISVLLVEAHSSSWEPCPRHPHHRIAARGLPAPCSWFSAPCSFAQLSVLPQPRSSASPLFSCSSPSQVSFLTRWRRRRAQELGPTLTSVPATALGTRTGSGSVPVSGARAAGDSVGLQPSGRALG